MKKIYRIVGLVVFALVPFILFHYEKDGIPLRTFRIQRPYSGARTGSTIGFVPCRTFEEHRLGVALSVILAKYLDRALLLPTLIANTNNTIKFSDLYSFEHFSEGLQNHDIIFASQNQTNRIRNAEHVSCDDSNPISCMEHLKRDFYSRRHLLVDCPRSSHTLVSPATVFEYRTLFWDVISALEPRNQMLVQINGAISRIRNKLNTTDFQFVEMSMGTHDIDLKSILTNKGIVPGGGGVYCMKNGDALMNAGFTIVNKESLDVTDASMEGSMVDYYMALRADKSITNHLSVFGAMVELERRNRGLYAASFQNGIAPLSENIPLFKIPWVFFHNASNELVDYVVKAAVNSALRIGTLHPICILDGNGESEIHSWLVEHNVTVIYHKPKWLPDFMKRMNAAEARAAQYRVSHRLNAEISIGNILQVELVAIPELMRYDFVLYTSISTHFQRRISLSDFGEILPEWIGLPEGSEGNFPRASSIVLWNLPNMRPHYNAMIEHVKKYVLGAKRQGVLVIETQGGKESVDQILERWNIPESLVSDSCGGFSGKASIVDFTGMAPHEFAYQKRTRQCARNICMPGIFRGWCGNMFLWARNLDSDDADAWLPSMRECYNRFCIYRGGCRHWKSQIAELS